MGERVSDLFHKHPDGSLEPNCTIQVHSPSGSVTLNPGVRFRQGVSFGGVDAFALVNSGAEVVRLDDGTAAISLGR